jgi:hypothetical protein
MVRIENVPWSDLRPEEKRVFEICREIIVWTHDDKSRLNFCESLRLIEEVTDLFERFGHRPFFHRREKLVDDLWEAELLLARFNEARKIYMKNFGLLGAGFKSAADAIIAMTARLLNRIEDISICRRESDIKFTKIWREDEDWIEVCVMRHPIEPDECFLITLNEMFCFRGGTVSPPHLLDFKEYLEDSLAQSGSNVDFSGLQIERLDHTHDDPDDMLIQKFVSIAGIKDGADLEIILNVIAQRIIETPRKFYPGI